VRRFWNQNLTWRGSRPRRLLRSARCLSSGWGYSLNSLHKPHPSMRLAAHAREGRKDGRDATRRIGSTLTLRAAGSGAACGGGTASSACACSQRRRRPRRRRRGGRWPSGCRYPQPPTRPWRRYFWRRAPPMNPSARRRRRGPPAINRTRTAYSRITRPHQARPKPHRATRSHSQGSGTYQREGECRRRREDAGRARGGGGVGVLRGRLAVVEDAAEAHALRRRLLHLPARATLPVTPSASGRRSKRREPGAGEQGAAGN
jgi:hypothetical protein